MKNRYRITYKKGQELRYTANLDMHRIWERWMRRANVPLEYSQGFHPQPRLNQAAPLPLGMLSECEMIDIWVSEQFTQENLQHNLLLYPQPGITVKNIEPIDMTAPALPTLVEATTYLVLPLYAFDRNELDAKISSLLDQQSIIRERRQKQYDLRPLVLSIIVEDSSGETEPSLRMELLAQPSKTGRPDEVMNALEYDPMNFRYIRQSMSLKAAS